MSSQLPFTSNLTSTPSPGLAVALSSSFFGFYAHAAFMRGLHDQGIRPAQIAGTSSGAVVAALCGAGLFGEALEDFVMQPGLRRSFLDWAAPFRFPGVVSTLFCSGILSGKNFIRFFGARLPVQRLEECSNPRVQLAVTNLTTRRSHLVEQGNIAEWVMASCSVPGLFCNHVTPGARWCDGGVALETPFEHWLNDPEVHTIVMHRIEHQQGTEFVPRWPSMASGFAASHSTISHTLHGMRMQRARESGKRIIEIVTETPHPTLFPHRVRPSLLDAGRLAGQRAAWELRQNGGVLHEFFPQANAAASALPPSFRTVEVA
jgi:predicted acylesterase/phospholipase RssA